MTRQKPGVKMLAALGVAVIIGGCNTKAPSSPKEPVLKPVPGGFEITDDASASSIPNPADIRTAGKCWQTVSEGGKSLLKEINCPAGGVTYVSPTASTPAPTTTGGSGATSSGSTTTPAPNAPATATTVAGQPTISQNGGWITITGFTKSNITGPFLPGQDQNTLWAGMQLPTNQVGSVRPFQAGGWSGSPGWSPGATVNPNILGTFSGDANSGRVDWKLPTASDDGSGGNGGLARWDGSVWTFAGWSTSDPPGADNYGDLFFKGGRTKYSWNNFTVY